MGNHTSVSTTDLEQSQPCDIVGAVDTRWTNTVELKKVPQVHSQQASTSSRCIGTVKKPTTALYPKRNFLHRKKYAATRQGLSQEQKDFLSAAGRGDLDMLQELLDSGVNIDTADANEMTALHHAAKNAREQVIRFLVSRGANVDASDLAGGFTPLHWVIINSSLQMSSTNHVDESVIALARGGCNMNPKDFNLATPLHVAAQRGIASTIDTLVRLGASPYAVDVTGRNCLQVAKSAAVREIMEKLHEKKTSVVYHVLEIRPSASPSPPSSPPPTRKQHFQRSLSPLSRGSPSPTPPPPAADVSLLRTLPKFGRMPSPNYPAPPPPRCTTPDYSEPLPLRSSPSCARPSLRHRPLPPLPTHIPSPLVRYRHTQLSPLPPTRLTTRRLSKTSSSSTYRAYKRHL